MYIKNVKISISKDKKLWAVMLCALVVAIALILYSVINIRKGVSIQDDKISIFSLESYKTKYKVTIKSNKNQNIYDINEYYMREDTGRENFRFEIINDNSLKFTSIYTDGKVKIVSDEQISSLMLNDYNLRKENLLSINTFISLYNDVVENNKDYITIKLEEEDNKVIYRLIANKEEICKDDNLKFLDKVSMIELVINKQTNLPIELVVYDNNENMYIDIVYEIFDTNSKIDEKLFAI